MPRINAQNLAGHQAHAWAALASAFDTCLSAKPYVQITLAEVASTAGMARNTIYNYAKDKAGLAAAVTGYAAKELMEKIEEISRSDLTPRAKLDALVRAMMTWVATGKYRAIIAFAISEPWLPDSPGPLGPKMRAAISCATAEGVEVGIFRHDFLLTLELLSGTAKAAAARIFAHPEELEIVSAEALRILLAGLSTAHG